MADKINSNRLDRTITGVSEKSTPNNSTYTNKRAMYESFKQSKDVSPLTTPQLYLEKVSKQNFQLP